MPISEIDGCSAAHWADVLGIIRESLEDCKFNVELVSSGDESGVIHARIVKNLFNDDVVICDVSGRNPNVMFELGLRLAFDKPTVVIKDDKTAYNFDTSPIEHVPYPRDLRYSAIQDFKKQLSQKVKATFEAGQADAEYSCFLKHFVDYRTAKSLPTEEVSAMEFILKELAGIRTEVSSLKTQITASNWTSIPNNPLSSSGGLLGATAGGPTKRSAPKTLVELSGMMPGSTLSSLASAYSNSGSGPFGMSSGNAHSI
ncbi:MAG: hypothetical protein U1F81_05505 [Verrucomicrobiaceae bacterium]